jgi:hypothetical protein
MSYPVPRRVLLTWAESQSLTVLEQARACVLAGVKPADADKLMRAYASGAAAPEEVLAGATLFYAVAYQLELRLDPSVTWATAQTWDVGMDVSATDPMAEAEAEAAVRTAIATGLPPREAGALTMAEIAAYGKIRREGERDAGGRRPPRQRVRRHR